MVNKPRAVVIKHRRQRTIKVVIFTSMVTCSGLFSGCGSDPEIGGEDPNAVALTAGPMPLRRLNSREYDNTVQDLLYVDMQPSRDFQFAADLYGEFTYPALSGTISTLEVRKYQDAAQALASEADLNRLKPCNTTDENCAAQFIETFGTRAYRRPLSTDEQSQLLGFYRATRAQPLNLGFDDSLRVVIEAMLQSPAFLYRWELGAEVAQLNNNLIRLNGYEVASRLSYFIWRSMPDSALLQAAAANHLSTKAEVEAQARRMLNSAKSREPVASFFEYWLTYSDLMNIEKDITAYPNFNRDLKQAMLAESRMFVENIIFDGDGRFRSLFTRSESFINSGLGDIYDANVVGEQLQAMSLNSTERSGLLTMAAFLADKGGADGSNPALRGSTLYRKMLCKPLPPPPNVIPALDPPSAGGTTRDRFETHTGNPCASACHALFDPIGFAFENYDGIGQFRNLDNGIRVDASSTLVLDGAAQSFDGAVALSDILADSSEVKACFARQWLRYALDRNEYGEADEPSVDQIAEAFVTSGDIKELIIDITTSHSFLYRQPSTGEVLQL